MRFARDWNLQTQTELIESMIINLGKILILTAKVYCIWNRSISTECLSIDSFAELKQHGSHFVRGCVAILENQAPHACVHQSVWTLNCDLPCLKLELSWVICELATVVCCRSMFKCRNLKCVPLDIRNSETDRNRILRKVNFVGKISELPIITAIDQRSRP